MNKGVITSLAFLLLVGMARQSRPSEKPSGEEIASQLGIHYNGWWKELEAHTFTDTAPGGTGSTFTAKTLSEAKVKMAEGREAFRKNPPESWNSR